MSHPRLPAALDIRPRRRWPWLFVLLAVGAFVWAAQMVVAYYGQPRAGLASWTDGRGMYAMPTTRVAVEKLGGDPWAIFELISVNGHPVPKLGDARAIVSPPITREHPGAINTFVLRRHRSGGASRTFTLSIPVARPSLGLVVRRRGWVYLYVIVGLINLLMGALVFWRRPKEPASVALLLLGVVAAIHAATVVPVQHGPLSVALRQLIFPFYGPALLLLALLFTSRDELPRSRLVLRVSTGVALLSGLTMAGVVLSGDASAPRAGLLAALLVVGLLNVIASLLFALHATWVASKPPQPLGVRRRARALGYIMVVSYSWPALFSLLSLVDLPPLWRWVGATAQMVVLAMFPLMMGYAILRVQMFDLRVVVRRGAVWAGISLAVLLGYVGLVAVLWRALGQRITSPVLLGVVLGGSVLGFGLVHLRVQQAVTRWLYRSRYLYAEAISRASAELARAQSRSAVLATVRRVLVDLIGCSRAYVAIWADEQRRYLATEQLAAAPSVVDELEPIEMPERLLAQRVAPIARALRTREIASAYDVETTQLSLSSIDDPAGEVGFFRCYGVDLLLPLVASGDDSDEQGHVVGLLVIGPRRDGRALDSGDRALLVTLANQVALALESSRAFDELRRLKDGLELQVAERTRELREALADLAEAQGRLVEGEKQASLARMVAGIVHEVNSPLGVLKSSSQSLGELFERLRSGEAARVERALEAGDDLARVMQQSSERLAQIVGGLTRFVSLDEGERKEVVLSDGLDSALLVLGSQLGSRVRVERQYADAELSVVGNPARLNQVFYNLLENAARAIDGEGRIRVDLERDGAQAVVTIADTGCGIADEQLANIFEFGFKRRAGGRVGMRMGLAYAKRVVDELQGEIVIDSEVGRGTEVRLTLPVRGSSPDAEGSSDS